MTQYNTLGFSLEQGVATITLNRPEAANGIDMEMARELMQAAIRCDEDSNVRAVLLTGSAGKMFCAGGDLKSFAAYGEAIAGAIKELTVYLHAAISRLARMEKPLIVAVNGTAAGAGFSLAIAGDLVLSAASAKYTMAYTAAGLTPDGSATWLLPRLVGVRRAAELILTNRRLSAEEALDWGLVNQVVADDELMDKARALASQLAKGPTRAFGMSKKLLLASFENSLETQMELEARGIAGMTNTADGREGIQAFMEKRAPQFSGK